MMEAFIKQLIWALGFCWHLVMAIEWYWWLLALTLGVVCAGLRAYTSGWHVDSATLALGTSSSHRFPVVFAGLLGLYIAILFTVTVFDRKPVRSGVSVNLDIISTWAARAHGVGGMRYELFVNSCMLVPLGFLLPAATGCRLRTAILVGLGIAFVIELAQLVTVRGWFELSDIILNVFGAALGYAAYATLRKVNSWREEQPVGKHFCR